MKDVARDVKAKKQVRIVLTQEVNVGPKIKVEL